jgi:hypothetical protein
MAKTQGAPQAGAGMTRAEVIEAAERFRGLTDHPGWPEFMKVLDHHRIQHGIFGHGDTSKRPGYYEGFLDAIDELANFPGMLAAAAELVKKEEVERAEEEETRRLKREKFRPARAEDALEGTLPFRTPVEKGEL